MIYPPVGKHSLALQRVSSSVALHLRERREMEGKSQPAEGLPAPFLGQKQIVSK